MSLPDLHSQREFFLPVAPGLPSRVKSEFHPSMGETPGGRGQCERSESDGMLTPQGEAASKGGGYGNGAVSWESWWQVPTYFAFFNGLKIFLRGMKYSQMLTELL